MKPYKFKPILKTTLWGGYQIAPFKGIYTAQPNIGESWEISGVPGQESVATRYRLNLQLDEPLDEPVESLNEPLGEPLFETIKSYPGISRAELVVRIGKSRATVARTIATLVAAGKIEHRGSKKTGGYYAR